MRWGELLDSSEEKDRVYIVQKSTSKTDVKIIEFKGE